MNAKQAILFNAVLLMAATSTALAGRDKNPLSMIVPPQAHYGGKSYSEWLQALDTWTFSIPGDSWDQTPQYDSGGANSGVNQSGPVFFLEYSWDLDPAHPAPNDRYATVQAGQAILADLDGWYDWSSSQHRSGVGPEELEADLLAFAARWTEFLTLVIDGVSVPIDGSMQSPFLTVATYQLDVPSDSVVANLVNGDPTMSPSVDFTHAEWIALIKPLPVGEHLIQIKGGNTGIADPQGTDHNIWWNWVNWHITVTP